MIELKLTKYEASILNTALKNQISNYRKLAVTAESSDLKGWALEWESRIHTCEDILQRLNDPASYKLEVM